jgi:hypothetical protein
VSGSSVLVGATADADNGNNAGSYSGSRSHHFLIYIKSSITEIVVVVPKWSYRIGVCLLL